MKKSDLPEFQWTPACQEGFDQLKKALTEAPVLVYPDYSKPFILETDTSLKGLGTVLSQKGDDNEIHVVAYASRSFRRSEKSMRDYSSAKIELMALKWSVCDKFKDYFLRSKFTVFTDNNPLCCIKFSKLGATQIRWLSELVLYDSDIVYRSGKSNLFADAFSRRPRVEEEIEKEIPPESDCCAIMNNMGFGITNTRGSILKKIQWHMHTGPWSLVNCLAGSLYEALYKVLMNIN